MPRLTSTWRTIYIALGIVALGYAAYAHLLVSGVTLAVLIVAGVLLILKGLAAR
jgi:hypothetical protein